MTVSQQPEAQEPEPAGVLAAYQAALTAMGTCGQRAVPILGTMIHSALSRISEGLNRSPSAESIHDSRRMVEDQLNLWADKAQENRKESGESKPYGISWVALVFKSTEARHGTRDEKFGREIADLSDRLRLRRGTRQPAGDSPVDSWKIPRR